MLKPEEDDLLMPSSILGYSSEHFQLRCLQFQPDAAHTNYVEMLARALLCHQTCCDRQHKQQPLLHNSKWLFSRHKCVLSSAGGKWGWNADAVRICRFEHKEVWRICLLITHTFFQCPARHRNSLWFWCKAKTVKVSFPFFSLLYFPTSLIKCYGISNGVNVW